MIPDGTVVRLESGVRRHGDLLVGGSPTTVLRLAPAAFDLFDGELIEVRSAAARAVAERLLASNLAHPVLDAWPEVDLAELTVVIPVKERAAGLSRLLSALNGQVRCVVVDDGSVAAADIATVTAECGAELLRLAVNVGPAAARNAGLARVRTEFVAFVDSDVVVQPADLAVALRHFADDEVALVGPRVRGRQGESWIERYEEVSSSLDLQDLPTAVRPFARVSWLPSACLVARVDSLGAGFDGSMRVGEDVDLVWRLIEAGHRVRYEPASVAWHDSRTTWRSWLGRKAYYGSSGADLHARHGEQVAPAVLDPVQALTVASWAAQRWWSAPVGVGLWLVSAARMRRGLSPELAARLAAKGVASHGSQAMGLALRHWWPLTVVACLVSRRARRATVAMAVLDAAVVHRGRRPRLDPVRFFVARRADDASYGVGLWLGAVRARDLGVLLPSVRWRSASRGGPSRS